MNEAQEIKQTSQKKELSKILKNALISCIIGFTAMLLIKSYSTIMDVQNKAWEKAGIPYDVKTEWILNNILSTTRFRTSFGNDGSTIANILQKIHYKIYLSAKSKIPDDDPFWIEFWEPATFIGKTYYSIEKQNESLKKLNLISSNESKANSFNNYNHYFFATEILNNMMIYTEYPNKDEEIKAYLGAIGSIAPLIEKLTKTKYNFYNIYDNKYTNMHYNYIQNIPENFITSMLVIYIRVIKKEKTKTCDNDLYINYFNKLIKLIHNKKNITLLIQGTSNLRSLVDDLNIMIELYNKQYKEHCQNN